MRGSADSVSQHVPQELAGCLILTMYHTDFIIDKLAGGYGQL